MGKSRGGKYHHKGRTPVTRLGPRGEEAAAADSEEDSGDEGSAPPQQRRLGGQSNTVGLLPPSDSESESETESEKEARVAAKLKKDKEKAEAAASSSKAAAAADSSSGEEESSSSEEDGGGPPVQNYLTQPKQKKVVNAPVERSPEEIRKEMERLQIIRAKREDDRIKRIAAEGYDRYAPISETNRPPGYVPSDHPSKDKS